MGKLTALRVKSIKATGYHADDGAVGLYLQVTERRGRVSCFARSWVYRFVSPVSRRVRWMGLGSTADIGLAEARDLAHACRRLVRDGIDPIERRNQQRGALRLATATTLTFAQCAQAYIEAHRTGWHPRHAQQWAATLATYCYPVIGALPVGAIDTPAVLRCLEPIWADKTVTAKRLRGRIENVLDFAAAREHRQRGDNPARWRGHLDKLLAKPSRLKQVKHRPALSYPDMPEFMRELRVQNSIAARALEVTALTALRTGEAIGATWGEFDLRAKLWTVPAERMKGRREHRVPLADRVIEILRGLPPGADTAPVFADLTGKPLHRQHAMLHVMQALRPGLTVHGLRSSFKDWASETTHHPNHVIEMALAHAVGNAVEAAYRRGDLFEKRTLLMRDWARYLFTQDQ